MQEATNSTIGAIRPCVNGTVEHEHLNTVSLCDLAISWHSSSPIRRHHKGWPITGLHPFLTSDMIQHEFKILKLNAKIQFSSGHKFLTTGSTVISFTLGICVSATAYLA